MSGVHFTYRIRQRDAAVQVIIERSDAEANARIFEALFADRDEIEADFGAPLVWDRVDSRKKCFIGVTLERGGYRDDESVWPDIQRAMIETMIGLDRTLRPRIEALRVELVP